MGTSQTALFDMMTNGKYANRPTTRSTGRNSGSQDDDFFSKKLKSLENAFGTVGASIASLFDSSNENKKTEERTKRQSASLDDIAKKYGYDSFSGVWDARDAAEAAGDTEKVKEIDNGVAKELQSKTASNAAESDKAARDWSNYRTNSYVGQKVNQDRGKYLGSAINTLSTMSDVMLPGAGVAFNAVQGGVEGLADELEQNGFENFDWGRAGQNALIGAATGGVTGALNKGVSNVLAKNGGNLFKGGNAITKGINNLGANTAIGRGASTLATGAARGALSGAVGGATGAGLSAALNNQDVIGSAMQGAVQGAQQGAFTGGVMSGVNMAANKLPGVGNTMQQLNEAGENWKNSGEDFNERLTNTLTSGDSAVGEWLQGNKQSRLLNRAGQFGNTVQDASGRVFDDAKNMQFQMLQETNPMRDSYHTGIRSPQEINRLGDLVNNYNENEMFAYPDFTLKDAQNAVEDGRITVYSSKPIETGTFVSPSKMMAQDYAGRTGKVYSKNIPIDDFAAIFSGDEGNYLPISNQNNMPSTLGGWLKQAGQRVVEDVNNRGAGLSLKDVSGDGMLNMKRGDELPLAGREKTLSELSGGEYKTVGDAMRDGLELSDIKKALSKKDYETLLQNAREIADINNPMEQLNTFGADSKSDLPILNRQQYYEDTIGSLRNRDGSKNNYVSAKDVPDYMRNRLSNNTTQSNDDLLREFFGDSDNKYDLNELYDRYERMAQGPNANEIYTPENIETGLYLAGKDGDRITNELANKLFANKRSLGVDNNTQGAQGVDVRRTGMPEDIRNMVINDGTQVQPEMVNADSVANTSQNPATQLYNSLNKQPEAPIDITSAFDDKGLGTIQQRNKLQSLGQQLQNAAKTQKFGPVFDSLDAGTARRATETQAPQRLAELGIQPQDYTEAAKVSSYVNRVVSDAAKKSDVRVNVPDLSERLSAASLSLPFASESNLKTYEQAIRRLTTPEGDSPSQYTASQLIETSRKLGQKAFDAKGNTDSAKELRNAFNEAKHAMRDIASEALAESGVTGDMTTEMIADGLRKLGANEQTIDYICAPQDGKAPTAKELIRRTSLFEQARDMGNQIEAEKYTRSASKAPANPMTRIWRASGLDQPIETILRSTVAPVASGITNMVGKGIEGAGNVMAGVRGNTNGGNNAITTETVTNPNYNPQTQLYNAIGRTEGELARDDARDARYLANNAQEAQIVQNNTMPMDSMGYYDGSTALYNAVNSTSPASQYGGASGQTNAMYNQVMSSGNIETGYFPNTGDFRTDAIAAALSRAIDGDDVSTFSALYPVYEELMANVSKSASSSQSSTKNTKLTDTQRRANAAMDSLEKISTMQPDLGYNLSGIPIVGDIATFGGNDYESEAKSLAQQIGYMLSGANIKEEEAYNIGKSYVPQPFDNEQTRNSKLQRAYSIIQQYQNGYAE